MARLEVNCSIGPSSKIELIKSDVCEGDDIMIDGKKCMIVYLKMGGP